MADNVTVDNGSLTDYVAATDDDGTAQHQYVKLEYGGDGTFTKVATGANALPIQDGGNSITVDGTVAVTQSGTWDEVGINDSGNSITVDDGGTTLSIDDGAGSITVDGTVAVSGTVTVDSELPAAGALADNTANPTAPAVGSFGHVWDGATWDRTPGTAADGVTVNLGSNNDVTVTGSVTANAGTNLNTSSLALESGGNLAGAATSLAVVDDWDESDRAKVNLVVGQAGITAGAGAVGASTPRVTLASDDPAVTALQVLDNAISGSEMQVDVVAALPAGTNSIGAVTPLPLATGGLTIFRSLDLDETEEEVKASAGTVYGWFIANTATSTRFVKFYNATAANVTVGTTTPVLTFPIPGNSSDDVAANALGGIGIAFDTAITVAATTGVADADTGAPGANEVVINIFYK